MSGRPAWTQPPYTLDDVWNAADRNGPAGDLLGLALTCACTPGPEQQLWRRAVITLLQTERRLREEEGQ